MAYVDPGTGSLIIQALIAGFLGALFGLRNKIKGLISRFVTNRHRDGGASDE